MSSKKSDTKIRILNSTWKLMESRLGQGVSMSDIAKDVGISRQALYLHFDSRTDLIIATLNHVDDLKGLKKRLQQFRTATDGIELLELGIETWGNYIPEIYGLAKAMLMTRDTDEATATAWNNRMSTVRDFSRQIVEALERDNVLAPDLSREEAIELLWTLLSVQNWEQLTIECGWTTSQYVARIKKLLRRSFVDWQKYEKKAYQEREKIAGAARGAIISSAG